MDLYHQLLLAVDEILKDLFAVRGLEWTFANKSLIVTESGESVCQERASTTN